MRKLIILATVLFLSCNSSYKISKSEISYLLKNEDKSKYYLVDLIRQNQAQNKLGIKPMLVVGSKIIYSWDGETNDLNLKKEDIKSVKIIEVKKVSKSYGSSGKYGIVIISKVKKSSKSKSKQA